MIIYAKPAKSHLAFLQRVPELTYCKEEGLMAPNSNSSLIYYFTNYYSCGAMVV